MISSIRNLDPYRKLMSRIALWVAPIASCAFILSFLLPEWRDYSAFERAALELTPDRASNGAFYALRENAITMTFSLRDHSATLAMFAWSWVGSWQFWSVLRPMLARRFVLVLLPIIIGLSLAVGCIASLMVDYNRYSYPSWADTMTIPAVGAIIASIGLALVMLLHVPILLVGRLRAATWIGRILSVYLSGALAMVGIAALMATVTGEWFALPTCLLVAFFLYGLCLQPE